MKQVFSNSMGMILKSSIPKTHSRISYKQRNDMTNSMLSLKLVLQMPLLLVTISFGSCNGQANPVYIPNRDTLQGSVLESDFKMNFVNPNSLSDMDDKIRCIFQDHSGNYWFGTNAAGVYRYDGHTLQALSEKDGLTNNQVQSIQEDSSGNIWFGTGMFGVCRFDGKAFTSFTNKEILQSEAFTVSKEKIKPDDLWFNAGGGVYRYNGNSLAYLPLDPNGLSSNDRHSSPFNLSRYAVYCLLKDRKGNLWFGTQAEGVCMYDGKSFTWFTEMGLAGPAVLGLFEDRSGNLWFGNNGSGLFRYDGKALINFTEDRGLSNPAFRLEGKPGPETLARIYSINQDLHGDIWIGTVDAGVWRFDGTNLKQYTAADGLTSNAINTIYKDNDGELWFGTDEDGVFRFNGLNFEKVTID
jgi:ligand-binding sensor domain-containing protein